MPVIALCPLPGAVFSILSSYKLGSWGDRFPCRATLLIQGLPLSCWACCHVRTTPQALFARHP